MPVVQNRMSERVGERVGQNPGMPTAIIRTMGQMVAPTRVGGTAHSGATTQGSVVS